MSLKIKWIGHASFRLEENGNVAYIDPWKLQDQPHDADVVIVSHSHYDHCSPEDVEKISKDDTAIIAPADTIEKLGASNAVTPGERTWIKDITIETVAAYNVGKEFHPRGQNWIGVVLTLGDKRVYYAGDTDLIDEMSDLQEIDVALLPIGGTYTLNATEAAAACERIGCDIAIPYHYGDIVGSESDADAFSEKTTSCDVKILSPGETFEIE